MFLTENNQIKWKKMGVAAIITALLVVLGITVFDKPLYVFLRELDCGLWRVFDYIFDEKVWLIISFIVLVLLYVKKCENSNCCDAKCKERFNLGVMLRNFFAKIKTSNAFLIFSSVLVTAIIVKVLKVVLGRARPVFFEALDMTGFFPFNFDWAFNSMPSGHTALTFAGLVMIGMLAPKYKVYTWSLAILVGVSRIAVGAHWPSDVILGAFIGMVVADLVKGFLLRKK